MEKKRVKKSFIILSLSIILILSISLVSANIFADLFKKFITGRVAGSGTNCVDSDGAYNFNVAGTVTLSGTPETTVYYDYCDPSGNNVAYDYYCETSGGGTVASLLPLTGNVISEPTLPAKRASMDCAASGLTCVSGGVCGCTSGKKSCGPTEAGIGVCTSGITTCNNGQWSTCTGATYPSTEVCTDGLDNDCDGYTDCTDTVNCPSGTTCGSGKTCQSGQCLSAPVCTPTTCSALGKQCGTGYANGTCTGTLNCGTCPIGQTCDNNGICQLSPKCTPGTLENCTVIGKQGICAKGQKTCLADGSGFGSCTQINFPTTETCNGIDDNCDGVVDNGATCSQAGYSCVAGTCIPGTCNAITKTEACAGKQCGSVSDGCSSTYDCGLCSVGSCVNNQCQAPPCTDADHDGYVVQDQNSGCGTSSIVGFKGYGDCNDNNASINPGATEICGNGIDDNCNGKADCADTTACPATLPACKNCVNDPNYCSNNNIKCGTTTDNCNDTITCPNTCLLGESCSNGECIQCTFGQSRECGSGIGECKKGTETCVNGKWSGNCVGGVIPTKEICDNKDNDCNNQTDEGLVGNEITCISQEYGCVGVLQDCFQGTSYNTCESMNLKTPLATEICGDNVDDNCDGSLVDGCGNCTDGEKSPCNTGNPCETAQQTCTNGTWGSCGVVSTDPDCNSNTTCTPLSMEICGKNVGICSVGSRTCKADGTWGECNDIKPLPAEICGNGLDDNCNGQVDEGCNTTNNTTSTSCQSNNDCSANYECKDGSCSIISNTINNGGIPEESTSFWKRLINFFLAIFRVGQVLLGGSITPSSTTATQVFCSDSDNGKSYFVAGSGEGLNQQGEKIWFADTCFKSNLNNQVDSCMGDNCYLAEYYCDGKYAKYEKHACEFGCSKGACIPTKNESQACQPYFDEQTWQLVNPCG